MGQLDKSLLQVNYRSPQRVDDKLFFVKEQQTDVEWLQQEAENWSLLSYSKSVRIGSGWIPIKTTVSFTNPHDPALFTAQYTITYIEQYPERPGEVNLNELYATSYLAMVGIGAGFFYRAIARAQEALIWAGIETWAEETWIFRWTPGWGDSTAAQLYSFERLVEQYIEYLISKGWIRYQ